VNPDTGLVLHTPKARHRFLDLYRGLFVVLMLEGHIVRELLDQASKASGVFQFHELVHGITGPGFFFGAGFTFAISAERRWDSVTHFSGDLLRRLGRSALLVAIGYALHFPYLSLKKTLLEATPAQWNELLAFGVLQCIGITLLLLYLSIFFLRDERRFFTLLLISLPLLVYGSTPLAGWSQDPGLPAGLRSAFTTETGSPYPLVPFSGFLVAGVLASWGFLRSGKKGREHPYMQRLLILGVALLAFAWIGERTILPSPSEDLYWKTGPNFFWIRLGILLILLSLLWFLEERLKKGIFPQWITVLGVESFFVYIVHLPLVYGWITNPAFDLKAYFGNSLGFPAALAVSAAFMPFMVLGAEGWRVLKRRQPITTRAALVWCALSVAWAFLVNPY
jgi:acyltransferase